MCLAMHFVLVASVSENLCFQHTDNYRTKIPGWRNCTYQIACQNLHQVVRN